MTCDVEAPELTSVQLSTFNRTWRNGKWRSNISPDGLPDPICKSSSLGNETGTSSSSSSNSSLLAQAATIDTPPEPVVFKDPEPPTVQAAGIVDAYAIPTYSVPDDPGLKVNLVETVQVSSGKATVKDIRMEYATSDTDAAFSFGIRGSIPLELKGVQQIPGKDLALFLDVGYVGETDYASPEVFGSSPLANILVSKTAFPENQQADGCPSVASLMLDEATNQWTVLNESIPRNTIIDNGGSCGYTLGTEHFSKIAVVSTGFANAIK